MHSAFRLFFSAICGAVVLCLLSVAQKYLMGWPLLPQSFVVPFVFMEKKLSEAQIKSLVTQQKTALIKGFTDAQSQEKINGKLIIDNNGQIVFGKQ